MALAVDLVEITVEVELESSPNPRGRAIEVSDTEPAPSPDLGLKAATFLCGGCRQRTSIADAFPLGRCACLQCRACLVKYTEGRLADALVLLKRSPATQTPILADRLARRGLPALPLRSLACPACGLPNGLDRGDVVDLCSATLRELEEAAAEAKLASLTRCPACGAGVELASDAQLPEELRPTGIPEFDRTLPRGFIQKDLEGRPLTREALVHRELHRFRCACHKDFCGECRVTPYHLGYTCEAWEERRRRPDCFFCSDKATSLDALLDLAKGTRAGRASSSRDGANGKVAPAEEERDPLARLGKVVPLLPLRAMRAELKRMGLSAVSSCVERQDVELLARSVHICAGFECRERLSRSCLRVLPCGHLCAGCKGEPCCPPCLTCSSNAEGGGSCPYCAEPLPPGPAIQLECGHAVHASCLSRRLGVAEKPGAGWQPPDGPLSFDFRRCPVCRARIGDVAWPKDLGLALRKAGELEAEVGERAVKRLKVDPKHHRDDAILPGGTFDGRPREYAMTLYQYHMCEECRKPYFGGERRCQADADQGEGGVGAKDARQLCGGCAAFKSGKACPKGHDPSFVEWKCHKCCSLAVWFCWGTTHFCDRCHNKPGGPPVPCPGRAKCPWGGQHPPNGSGEPFCVGCSLCRHRDD